MAEDHDKTDKAKKRAVLFSSGIGAGISGGTAKTIQEGLKPLEHVAPKLKSLHNLHHYAGLAVIPMAVAGGVMGAREKKLQLEMAGNPQKRREYMRATGITPSPVAKTAGLSVPPDSGRLISGRDSYAQGTEGVEQAVVDNTQGLLDAAFKNKAKMSQQAEKQLKGLYPKSAGKSYGHSRTVGKPASEVSSMIARAFASAPKDPPIR